MIPIIILLLIVLLPAAYAGLVMAPFFPIWKKDLNRIERIVKLKPGDRFVELGSGFGDVSLLISDLYPENLIVSWEIQPLLFFISRIRAFGIRNLEIKYGDFTREDLSTFDMIYLYSTPTGNKKITAKLKRELKSGTEVVSYAFPFEDWTGGKIFEEPGRLPIFSYKIH